jgi:hypothetical protein
MAEPPPTTRISLDIIVPIVLTSVRHRIELHPRPAMVTKRLTQGAGRTPTGTTPALTSPAHPYPYVRIPRNPAPSPISNRHLVKLKCDVTPTKQTTAAFLIGNRCTNLLNAILPITRSVDFSLRAAASHAFPGVRQIARATCRSATQPGPSTTSSRSCDVPRHTSITASQRSGLTEQLLTLETEPVESQLIISNRSVPRLETPLTPTPSTKVTVLIDTNSDTKNTTSSPPAPLQHPWSFISSPATLPAASQATRS